MNCKKQVIIVLGGTAPTIDLIKNLKNRGFYVILVDYYENPPAKPFADEHILVSTLDKEGVLEVARKTKASFVINLLIDPPIVTSAYVAEKLNLPSFISYENAQLLTNKRLMKKRMFEYQIPTAKYCIIDNNIDLIDDLNLDYPQIAKPISGSGGSIGVKKINCYRELKNYLHDNENYVLNGGVIVEEHYKGIEIQVGCFVREKTAHIIMIQQKEKITVDGKYEMVQLGSSIPVQISPRAEMEIYAISQRIVEAFQLENTPMFFQAFVDNDSVNVIEIAARIGGILSCKLIKVVTGFDILDYSLSVLFGEKASLHYEVPKYLVSTVIIYAKQSIFGKITGLEELVEQKIIEDFSIGKTTGMIIPAGITARNRTVALIIKAESKDQMKEKIDYIYQQIDVLDINGNSVMLRELKKTV